MKELFLGLFLAVLKLGLAQQAKSVHIINRQTSERLVIYDYEKMKVYANNTVYKGHFQILNDSIIQIANAKIFVSDITVLKYTNWKNRIKRFTGFTTIGFGTGIVLVGVADYILTKIVNIFNFNISYTRPIALMSSGSMTIVSGILILKSKKSFNAENYKMLIYS
jgi:hypothetical protein